MGRAWEYLGHQAEGSWRTATVQLRGAPSGLYSRRRSLGLVRARSPWAAGRVGSQQGPAKADEATPHTSSAQCWVFCSRSVPLLCPCSVLCPAPTAHRCFPGSARKAPSLWWKRKHSVLCGLRRVCPGIPACGVHTLFIDLVGNCSCGCPRPGVAVLARGVKQERRGAPRPEPAARASPAPFTLFRQQVDS